jgi:hypothetical protein
MKGDESAMYKHIGTITMISVSFFARAQTLANLAPVHPSNGVLEVSATPTLLADRRPASQRHDIYGSWGGLIEITIRNVSRAVVQIDEMSPEAEFVFEVLDSAGQPVAFTEHGKRNAEGLARHAPNLGWASRDTLAPLQETTLKADISKFFQIEPGHAYKVTVRRTRGLPKNDETGKPLKQVEISCSFEVPDVGILR